MNQCSVNPSLTFRSSRQVAAIWLVIILAGSGANEPVRSPARTAWQPIRLIARTVPHEQPALWADSSRAIFAWPGDPTMPGIFLADLAQAGSARSFHLGTIPHRVNVYPSPDGSARLLWMDQTLPDEEYLAAAVVRPDGEIERDAIGVNNEPTLDYSAVSLFTGELTVFWVGVGRYATPLFLQRIDESGLPRPPVQIAASAMHPSAAVDVNGRLRVAWLESNTPGLWVIHYAVFPADKPDIPKSDVVGLISLGTGEALESFGLGLDATYAYCLWNIVTAGDTARLSGLAFPLDAPMATRALAMNDSESTRLHWPAIPSWAGQSLTVALTDRQKPGHEVPVTVAITPDQIGLVQPVPDVPDGIIGKTSLVLDTAGDLHLAWTTMQDNGTAAVYYTSTRP